MKYEVDDDYEFDTDEYGDPLLPKGVKWNGNLCILPNGKYLPRGLYVMDDGSSLIYEPKELSPFADMLAQFQRD